MKHFTKHDDSAYRIPRRVMFLDHCARMSGGEIALLHLVQELDGSKVRPSVLLGEEGLLHSELDHAGVDCTCLNIPAKLNGIHRQEALRKGLCDPLSLIRLLIAAVDVSLRARRSRTLLLHGNSLKSDIIGGIAGRLADIRVIWHVRDRLDSAYMPLRVCRLFRSLCRSIPDGVIANSRSTLLSLFPDEGMGKLNAHQCRAVIHDGVPLSAFSPLRPSRKTDELTVGMIGRIASWKGQRIFIEAANRIHSRFPAVRFVIVGSALFGEEDYEREITALVEEEQADYIRFMGYQPNPQDAMRDFDILVHASVIGEPFGQVVIEGMASGIPVVATNGGGIPEIIRDGENGLLAEAGNVVDLAECIEKLIINSDLRDRLAEAGRESVLERFTVCQVARKVEMFYDRLLNELADG